MLGIAAASAMPIDPAVYSGLQRNVSCDDVGPSARNSLLTLSIRINI